MNEISVLGPPINSTCIKFPTPACKRFVPNCLERHFDQRIPSTNWISTPVVDSLLRRSNDVDVFRRILEGSIHPYPHLGFGGHMRTMCSAADPVFFLRKLRCSY